MAKTSNKSTEAPDNAFPNEKLVASPALDQDGESAKIDIVPSFERTPDDLPEQSCSFIEYFMVFLSYTFVILFFPFFLPCVYASIRQFERGIILRNGKVHKNRCFGPGLVFTLPCVDTIKIIDLRIVCYAVPPQEALTKDSLTVSVDAIIYYSVHDPVAAVINIADFRSSTHLLAATTIRNALGTRKLQELLRDRTEISTQVLEQTARLTNQWGIHILRIDIKDIRLPLQLQKAMAAEAESSRLANAKIIVAKAEIEATKNLQKASDILSDNPMCMQLRYLQSLHTISGPKTHTIVFPFSKDAFANILQR